jgi:restriction system protein
MAVPVDDAVPSPENLVWPVLAALRELGWTEAAHQELMDKVVEMQGLPETVQNIMHSPAAGWTRLSYNLGIAKLKGGRAGLFDVRRETKGRWIATSRGRTATEDEVRRLLAGGESAKTAALPPEEAQLAPDWKTELLSILGNLPPAAFERLVRRLLQASGFTRVEVTGKSGDEGLDGHGVVRIAEVLSFLVYFQCKRYHGNVGSTEVRNFRGALSGRSDKGLFVTTGGFTAEARREATRDGVVAIDLIDGAQLCDLLKKLRLGVDTRMVEEVLLDRPWFEHL